MEQNTIRHLQQHQPPAPSESVFLARLDCYHRALEHVYIPLRDRTDDLAVDWAPRDETCWREMLDTLHHLRAAISSFLAWLEQDITTFPLTFLQTRQHVKAMLYRADTLIDEAGIAVTAYLPQCASSRLEHLQARHIAYERLQALTICLRHVLGGAGVD
jgi:hypothetical protein